MEINQLGETKEAVPAWIASDCASGVNRPNDENIIKMNPHAATSIPRPILRGADGYLPFLDNAPKIAMETGVKATTKNGLNCWKIGASTGTEPLSEL